MSFIRRKSKRITKTKKAEDNLKFILTTSDMSLLKLCVKNTNEMGRGVFCTSSIQKGDYVLEYRGTRLNEQESKTRHNEIGDTGIINILDSFINFIYHIGYIFWFKNDGKWICIDATSESSHPGRLVNHSKLRPNLIVKCINTHLVFVALDNIKAGSQLLFDYNDNRPDVINDNIWMKN